MAGDWPTSGNSYLIQSRATGCQLGVHGPNGPGWDEQRPHVAPRPTGQGAAWLLESVDLGFRLTTKTAMPWSSSPPNPMRPWEGPSPTPVPADTRLDSNLERQVYASLPNDGPYQKWSLRADGEGYWMLLNVATDLALDGTDEDIYTLDLNDGHFQRWHFIRVG